MLPGRWWRIPAVCAASLGATWLAPRDGTLEPGLIGLVILALGLALNFRPSPAKRVQPHSAAVEQLRSAEAAERTAGIRALERAAEEDPSHRQEVVDLLCGYLRKAGRSEHDLEVRRIAQQTLTSHLRTVPESQGERGEPVGAGFWSDIDLDLSGATLHHWDMEVCHVRRASFRDAQFDDRASFSGTRFDGRTTFVGARFADKAAFNDTVFNGEVTFQTAHFHGGATFIGAYFGAWSWFSSIRFYGKATFDNARFNRRTTFNRTRFGGASFSGTRFSDTVTFNGARINDAAVNRETVLKRARFDS